MHTYRADRLDLGHDMITAFTLNQFLFKQARLFDQCFISILKALPNVSVGLKPLCEEVNHLRSDFPLLPSYLRCQRSILPDPLDELVDPFRGHVQAPCNLAPTEHGRLVLEQVHELMLPILLLLRLCQLHKLMVTSSFLWLLTGLLDHLPLHNKVALDLWKGHLTILHLLALLIGPEATIHQ
jgi:hypothetical protein